MEFPEFYATYKLLNLKNHHVYSDKFILIVIDLTKIDMATDEDKIWKIDYWAKLFKACTWEELKMIAEKDENLREASESLYKLNADDIARQKCRAREDQLRLQRKMEHKIESLTQENIALSSEIEKLKEQLASLQS